VRRTPRSRRGANPRRKRWRRCINKSRGRRGAAAPRRPEACEKIEPRKQDPKGAFMENWIRIGSVSEVPSGTGRVYEAGGSRIAVFNVNGIFHAIDNTCLHQGGPLGEGTLEGKLVTCPLHHWQYD